MKIERLRAAFPFPARTEQRQGAVRQVDIVRHKNIFFQPQARIHAYLPAQMGPFFHDDALTQVRAFPQMDMVLQAAACLQTRSGPQHAARAGRHRQR